MRRGLRVPAKGRSITLRDGSKRPICNAWVVGYRLCEPAAEPPEYLFWAAIPPPSHRVRLARIRWPPAAVRLGSPGCAAVCPVSSSLPRLEGGCC